MKEQEEQTEATVITRVIILPIVGKKHLMILQEQTSGDPLRKRETSTHVENRYVGVFGMNQ